MKVRSGGIGGLGMGRWSSTTILEATPTSIRIGHDVHIGRLTTRQSTSRHIIGTHTHKLTYLDGGAGRNPAADCWPGPGFIAGWGPNRGLKGTSFRTGGGALGFVEETN